MIAPETNLNISVEVMSVRVIGSDRVAPLIFPEIVEGGV
jgi:hypothetical protein